MSRTTREKKRLRKAERARAREVEASLLGGKVWEEYQRGQAMEAARRLEEQERREKGPYCTPKDVDVSQVLVHLGGKDICLKHGEAPVRRCPLCHLLRCERCQPKCPDEHAQVLWKGHRGGLPYRVGRKGG